MHSFESKSYDIDKYSKPNKNLIYNIEFVEIA